jgi:putative DNA primase/helicase
MNAIPYPPSPSPSPAGSYANPSPEVDDLLIAVAATRDRYWDHGWRPLPVYSWNHSDPDDPARAGKAPLGERWTERARQNPPECISHGRAARHALNTGILCDGLRVIDIDVEDHETARKIRELAVTMFGDTIGRYRDNSARSAHAYRAAEGSPGKRAIVGTAGLVEVLGHGQQLVSHGTHQSGAPIWWSPTGPDQTNVDHLPDVTEDLITAFLKAVAPLLGADPAQGEQQTNGQDHEPAAEQQADPLRIAAALLDIPNDGPADWEAWNRVAMATWAATAGGDMGWIALDAWSQRNAAYDPDETRRRWDHYRTSPPTQIGAGTIFHMAAEARARPGPRPKDDAGAGPRDDVPPNHAESATDDAGLVTEDSVALAFADRHQRDLRYCHHTGAWFRWTGFIWKREETKLAFSWARRLARELAKGSDNIKAMLNAGKASFAAGVERLAQSDREFAVTSETWDADRWLLGTPGGTVDLRTGQLREARQSDYITKVTGCTPAATPDCPLWLQFLDQTTNGDAGLIRFMRQWAGYSLTGDIREDALVFVHGTGGNGKGVFLGALIAVMGDYCQIAAMDTFVANKNERIPADLAMLKGARMVCVSETEEGRAWAESRIKQMTGRDKITARFMRQNFFTYLPEFKLTIIGNHKPVLKNVDDAAKRRFNMVPFVHKPPSPDRQLDAQLADEHPAILRWMIDGCIDWQQNGLVRPQAVIAATASYFDDQDTMRQWIEECCETGPNLADTGKSLFSSWSNYAKSRGEEVGSQKRFNPAMEILGFRPVKDESGIRGRGFKGLRVTVTRPNDYDAT